MVKILPQLPSRKGHPKNLLTSLSLVIFLSCSSISALPTLVGWLEHGADIVAMSLLLRGRGLLKINSRWVFKYNCGMSSKTPPHTTPVVPQLSASLLLINTRNEILLVHRPTHSSTFPNAHVFPGGTVASSDNESKYPLKLCAIRETFEETGLLLTTPPPPPSVLFGAKTARSDIHAGRLSFVEYLSSHGLKPAVDGLIPFTKWITPEVMPRRFETHMFLYLLPEDNLSASGFGPGLAEEEIQQLPTGDGGIEILSTRFITPKAALEAARSNEILFPPPQFYLISMLLPFLEESTSLEDRMTNPRRERLVLFAEGEFGKMTIKPHPLKKLSDGRATMGLGSNGDYEDVMIIQLAKKGEPRGLEILKKRDVAKL